MNQLRNTRNRAEHASLLPEWTLFRRLPPLPAIPLLLLSILTLPPPTPASADSCGRPEEIRNEYDVSTPTEEELPGEVGEPELISAEVSEPEANDSGELQSEAKMHALFSTDIDAFERALRRIEEQPEFLPRLAESEVLCSSGDPRSYAEVRQLLRFRFLFFRREYEYVLHYTLENPDADTFVVWWVLKEPVDDQIVETEGSWHFERIRREGEEYTYMSYATRTIFRRKRAGLRAALERFGARDVRNAMLALDEEARRTAE